MSTLPGKKLVHVTTVDMSLVLLLGPQLRAFAEAGMEVVGVSAARTVRIQTGVVGHPP